MMLYERYARVRERIPISHIKRHWLTVSFFLGFLIDNLTLNRVDQVFDNLVLAWYVILAGGSLIVLYASHADKVREDWQPLLMKWSPMVLQFSFGGLLSGILIFYGRSGSWLSSWPFLLVILTVIVGNELLKRRAQRLIFNIVILFIAFFSYVELIVPVVVGSMGAWLFVFSGVLALIGMYGYVRLLARVVPQFIFNNTRPLVFSLGVTFFVLNFLYFANIIPPIPLSLKDMGIYHNVEKLDNGYRLTYEKGRWWEPFKDSDTTYHYQSGDTVFCFSSVFAPTRLSTTIYHRWEYYDEENREWRTHDRLSYPIEGGRDGGFRGFTSIRTVQDGIWRCSVETERKQILGREKFEIETAPHGELVTELD